MKWINKIKLIYRSCTQRIFVSLLLLGMCTVSFYMMDGNLEGPVNRWYADKTIHDMFGTDTENISYVTFLGYEATRQDADILKEYLLEQDEVITAGYFSNQNIADLVPDEEMVGIFLADVSLVDMGNLKLSEELKQTIGVKKDGCYQVLLGCNYKGKVEVGDTFEMWNQPCVVAGFLEKGVSWPRRGEIAINIYNVDYNTLDNMGILLVDDYAVFDNFGGRASELYYIVQDGKSEEVAENLKEYALENKIAIKVVGVEDMIQEVIDLLEDVSSEAPISAAMLLTILAVASVSASATIMCLINKRQYGVMMICGVKQKDIMWMIVVQNGLYYLIGGIASWIISRREVGPELVAGTGYMIAIMVVIGLIMLAISSIVPLIIIKRTTLIEMLHRK